MKIIEYPDPSTWANLTQRPAVKQETLTSLVHQIFAEIQAEGDRAVEKYSLRFDGIALPSLQISAATVQEAVRKTPKALQAAIQLAKANIEKFHAAQQENVVRIETTQGVRCWRENRPIEQVGIYIPGGSAPLFSTVLMLGIPAKLAGCKEIVLCTPPDAQGDIHPAILFAAQLVGVSKIFAVGGIQAIGAMTFGTASIPKVLKIFGPGNQYVTAAKQVAQNYGVAIDMPAGPSEVLVIADDSCNPAFVAADLLSQAEHGPDSQVMLLSDRLDVVQHILAELQQQLEALPRKEIATQALQNSKAIILPTLEACLTFSNAYAPEHLIIALSDYDPYIQQISNAGSVFLGHYSCESAGDYASGTNHTLPTNGYARNYSGVSLDSFVKKITFQALSAAGIQNIGPAIALMAEAEQLMGHKNAVTVRLAASVQEDIA